MFFGKFRSAKLKDKRGRKVWQKFDAKSFDSNVELRACKGISFVGERVECASDHSARDIRHREKLRERKYARCPL